MPPIHLTFPSSDTVQEDSVESAPGLAKFDLPVPKYVIVCHSELGSLLQGFGAQTVRGLGEDRKAENGAHYRLFAFSPTLACASSSFAKRGRDSRSFLQVPGEPV